MKSIKLGPPEEWIYLVINIAETVGQSHSLKITFVPDVVRLFWNNPGKSGQRNLTDGEPFLNGKSPLLTNRSFRFIPLSYRATHETMTRK